MSGIHRVGLASNKLATLLDPRNFPNVQLIKIRKGGQYVKETKERLKNARPNVEWKFT